MKKIMISIIYIMVFTSAFAGLNDWRFIESDYFVVFYPESYRERATEVIEYLEEVRSDINIRVGNSSDFKTRVVIVDQGDNYNGIAESINRKLDIFTSSATMESELGNLQSWSRLVATHEQTHIAQLTNSSGFAKVLTTLFGDGISPNQRIPDWMVEGIAVYSESQSSPYEGRVNGTYFKEIVSKKAEALEFPNQLTASNLYNSYPLGNYYIYGGAFFDFLSKQYGKEKIAEFFKINGRNIYSLYLGELFPFFGIDKSAKKTFGKSFKTLFREWKEHEESRVVKTDKSSKIVDKYGIYYGNIKKEGKTLFFTRRILKQYGPFGIKLINQLVEYSTDVERLRVVKEYNGEIENLEISNGKLYYSVSELKRGFINISLDGYDYIKRLVSYDFKSKEFKEEIKGDFKTFMVSGDSFYLFRERMNDFGSEILVYKRGEIVKKVVLEELVSEAIEVDGTVLVVSKKREGSWNINSLDMDKFEMKETISTPYAEYGISVFENKLCFTSNYQGKMGIYSYGLNNKEVELISDCSFAKGGAIVGDELYFIGIDSSGEVLKKGKMIREVVNFEREIVVEREESSEDYIEKRAFGKNMSYLFFPSERFFPTLLRGKDGIGFNRYYGEYLGDEININFESKLFSPLNITFEEELILDDGWKHNKLTLEGEVLLYKRIKRGLTELNVSLESDLKGENEFGVEALFSEPYGSLRLNMDYLLSGDSYKLSARYAKLIGKYNFNMNGDIFENYDNDMSLRVFDVNSTIVKNRSYRGSVNMMRPLLKVRRGVLNPNVYINDLFVNGFVDYLELYSDKKRVVSGVEILGEVNVAYNISVVPKFGVGFYEGEYELFSSFIMRF